MREAFQSADALHDGLRHASCGLWAALGDEVADPFEVVRGVRRPADAHQPRYRRSMRDTTSSCSTRRPSLAEARPFSTSTRNHSSWSIELAKKVECDLVDGAPRLGGQAGQLRFEFGRNLQVHDASVEWAEGPVNSGWSRGAG